MKTRTLSVVALALGLLATGTSALAQAKPATAAAAKPDVNFITQTTAKIVIPDGGTEDEMWKMQQEYFDKVIAKSTLVKHYQIYRHNWGSTGASVVLTFEFATWADIHTFNDTERDALEKAAWPDETARKAFMKKMSSYEDPYHRDEIYVISNTMRK